MHEKLERNLLELAGRSRLRALHVPSGIDFTSNDYLGLAESDVLRQAAADALARSVSPRAVPHAFPRPTARIQTSHSSSVVNITGIAFS